MAAINTVNDVWQRCLTFMGLRESTVTDWFKMPDEVLEQVYDAQLSLVRKLCQLIEAKKAPDHLLGTLHKTKTYEPNLGSCPLSVYGAMRFLLPTDVLRIIRVWAQMPGTGKLIACDMKHSDCLVMLSSGNYYWAPENEAPWAFVIDDEVWIAPLDSSLTSIYTMLDMVALPDDITSLNASLQVVPELRLALVYYTAFKLCKKKNLDAKANEALGLFTVEWQEAIGIPWQEAEEKAVAQ